MFPSKVGQKVTGQKVTVSVPLNVLYYSQNEVTRTFNIKSSNIYFLKRLHKLNVCTWSAVVFSAMDFHNNPPHIVGSHYIACSATENTLYHAGDWKNTPTICSEKSWEMQKTRCSLCSKKHLWKFIYSISENLVWNCWAKWTETW